MSIPPYYLEESSYDEQSDGPADPCYSAEEFQRAQWLTLEETYLDEPPSQQELFE